MTDERNVVTERNALGLGPELMFLVIRDDTGEDTRTILDHPWHVRGFKEKR